MRGLAISLVASCVVLVACGGSTRTAAVHVTTAAPATPHGSVTPAPTHGSALAVQHSRYGPILIDDSGRTLYLFTHDRGRSSSCYGDCASAWPPFLTQGGSHGRRALSAPLETIRRHDGSLQVTYAGHPLYYYSGDLKPGDILCQAVDEFGGSWYVVSPTGQAIRRA